MKNLLQKLLSLLAEGHEVEEVLSGLDLAPEMAAQAMDSPAGQEEIAARQRVSRTQTQLQARRHAAAAVRKLCGLLDDEKGELQLKAAIALLDLAHEEPKGGRAAAPAAKAHVDEAEVKEWMIAISKVLLDRRRSAAIGPAPRKDLPRVR